MGESVRVRGETTGWNVGAGRELKVGREELG